MTVYMVVVVVVVVVVVMVGDFDFDLPARMAEVGAAWQLGAVREGVIWRTGPVCIRRVTR
jgi:hypothetical protein